MTSIRDHEYGYCFEHTSVQNYRRCQVKHETKAQRESTCFVAEIMKSKSRVSFRHLRLDTDSCLRPPAVHEHGGRLMHDYHRNNQAFWCCACCCRVLGRPSYLSTNSRVSLITNAINCAIINLKSTLDSLLSKKKNDGWLLCRMEIRQMGVVECPFSFSRRPMITVLYSSA